jgi:hypothetical protein
MNVHVFGSSPAKPSDAPPWTIGWKEYLRFPDWRLGPIKAKIDTGARTSALGIVNYELHRSNGTLMATLHLALNRLKPQKITVVQTPILRMVVVSNSGGIREERPLIETTISLGPVCKLVQFTVANRSSMRFAMILGRKALEKDFVVDVSRKYIWGKKDGARRQDGSR